MHGCRESDSSIVPRKPSNKGCSQGPAEKVKERELAKANGAEQTRGRTQCRGTLLHALCRVRQAPSGACASDPRQEPGAVVPHAGICAGGAG